MNLPDKAGEWSWKAQDTCLVGWLDFGEGIEWITVHWG